VESTGESSGRSSAEVSVAPAVGSSAEIPEERFVLHGDSVWFLSDVEEEGSHQPIFARTTSFGGLPNCIPSDLVAEHGAEALSKVPSGVQRQLAIRLDRTAPREVH
jgi:hypothetical protein